MIEIIGWLGNIGFFLGSSLLAKLKRIGWLSHAFGNIMYVIYGILQHSSSIFFLSIILLFIDIIGWKNWGKKKKRKKNV